MHSAILPISSLFVAISLLSVGYGLLMSLVGIRLQEFGASQLVTGVVNSTFFLGAIVSSLSAHKIVSRVGHIRSFGVFAALLTFATLAHSLNVDPLSWAFFRGVSGFAFYSMLLIIESWINEKTDSAHRSQVLSIYTVIFYLATSSGQLMLNIDDETGLSLFVLAAMFIVISLLPVAMTRVREPELITTDSVSLPKLYKVAKLATAASFAGGLLVGGFFTMAPVFMKNQGFVDGDVSYFMSIALIGGLLSQWPIGWISDRLGRKLAILYVAFFAFIVSGIMYFLADFAYALFVGAFFLGGSIFAIYPLSVARANDTTDEDMNAVEISRSLLMTYGIGSFMSPLIIGGVMGYIGGSSIFMVFGIIGLFLGLYSIFKDRVPFDERSVYVNVPSASGLVAAEFDPRQDDEWVEEQKESIHIEESYSENTSETAKDEEKNG
ncbi:MAG: MFS transporter [Campylobacterales bacterium]